MEVENIPENVLEAALRTAVSYKECPECGEEQFVPMATGRNTKWDCNECGETSTVVG